MTIVYVLIGIVLFYLVLTLLLTFAVQQYPRKPVVDTPDWGHVTDTFIPAVDGGSLEVWRIDPEGESRGIVVLAHGWSRNRDRMVPRARMFARFGFTTVIHSARDHGNSSPRKFMNAAKFAEDIAAVLEWVGEPVILYGHSAGSAGAIIAARAKIVEGAVGMVEMALDMLAKSAQVHLDEERKAQMVSNLLVVLCGDKDTQPVVNTGTIYQ